MPSLPSFHDDYLVGYDVDCEARTITLRIRAYSEPGTKYPVVSVQFTGVLGYQFEDDAFGNIIYSLQAFPSELFFDHFQAAIVETIRYAGLPSWMGEKSEATRRLTEKGIQCFTLDSSLGLSGWILARDVAVVDERSRTDRSPSS
jgi:hypothetical protein